MTFRARFLAKSAASYFFAGSGDAVSAITAADKVEQLGDLLQHYYQGRALEYDGSDIARTNDVLKAILYVRHKKQLKTGRRAFVGGTKAAVHAVTTAGGFTVGSVVPGLGNVLGGIGGYVAGLGLAPVVSVLDRAKRTGKGLYKLASQTRGVHRKQAAEALMEGRKHGYNLASGENIADDALLIILGSEYSTVVGNIDIGRLADRMKSN